MVFATYGRRRSIAQIPLPRRLSLSTAVALFRATKKGAGGNDDRDLSAAAKISRAIVAPSPKKDLVKQKLRES